MLEHTVPEGCGKSVDGAALTMLSGELIKVDTKIRNGQSLMERLFRYYLVSRRLNTWFVGVLSAIGREKKGEKKNT